MTERREVIEERDGEMAVIDMHRDVFGVPRFVAGVIRTIMRPTTVCQTYGTFKTREEALNAATTALSSTDRESPK